MRRPVKRRTGRAVGVRRILVTIGAAVTLGLLTTGAGCQPPGTPCPPYPPVPQPNCQPIPN
ncbi:hypothetical protein E0F15_17155 [Frankia sp. B2]|uniref:hypothetical protein n=1 Tax=Frankia sp. B2 TaxID=2541730 RepID=UPI00097623DD|nr:hypothetical protein [Frankia sp. B2]ORT98000.1 hypothetical protein UK99_03360 [Frankia casuarinae]TFE27019.1 hypothetical protein E0F15_17155 [Frankia sp. B2]